MFDKIKEKLSKNRTSLKVKFGFDKNYNELTRPLVAGIMGQKNYNKAMGIAEKMYINNDVNGVKTYVADQLAKIKKQQSSK